MTTNRKIARASLILMATNILVFSLGLGKEVLVAARFGISNAMDAFYAASTIPNLLNNVILSTFIAVFIPVFVRSRYADRAEADRVASVTVNYIFLFLALLSALIFVFAPWIVRYGFYGFAPETAAHAVSILRVLCFSLIFTVLSGSLIGILNAQEHFFVPALSQAFISLTTIAFILFFYGSLGIRALVYGWLGGLALQFLFLYPVVRNRGYRHSLDLDFSHPAIRGLLLSTGTYLLSIVALQLNVVVDKVMAARLSPGSVSALTYADRLVQVPLIIFSGALVTAVFPFFSSQAAQDRIDELKDSLARSIRMAGFIFIPANVLMIVFAKPLIQILFQRGAFDSRAAELTATILVCYSFQYVFYAVEVLLSRVFLAMGAVATLARISLAGFAVNLTLNIVFMKLIDPPVAGIALSTSVTYLFTMLLDFLFLKRKLDYLHGMFIVRGMSKILVSSGFMAAAAYAMYAYVSGRWPAPDILVRLTNVTISGASGVLVFAVTAYLFRLEEMTRISAAAAQRIRKIAEAS